MSDDPDFEKGVVPVDDTYNQAYDEFEPKPLAYYHRIMKMFHGETRGIERVPEVEKTQTSVLAPSTLWFAINMVIVNYALGVISYPIFGLDFGSSLLTIIFFNILGSIPVAFFSIFGARFGLRQMIISRSLVGVITSKLFAVLNCIACVGWAALNTMSSAQLLHIVNNQALPAWAGCLIVIACTILVSFFGYNVIHAYERWSWIPNTPVFVAIIARFAMAGVFKAGIQNDDGEWVTWGKGPTLAGGILSFGGAIFGASAGWATYAADYTTYMKTNTSAWRIFFGVLTGLSVPLIFTEALGAACVTGIKTDPTYAQLYREYSVGGLIYAILVQDSLHGFGQFLCVLLALSTVCNNIPNMYSIALGAQSLWSKFAKVPRVTWTVIGNGLVLAICIPAYYKFSAVVKSVV
ncbi:DEKNAAC105075 [Brettanomyces naardenensis]|uniref:DEKNAAC105075 n=1 Tax=Brettanomyces naardenensis TaxID=13370 RepID=A0A448YSJ9_BRENA|nr:DEKNAAC105075 [Brettanomyces naardenensis]